MKYNKSFFTNILQNELGYEEVTFSFCHATKMSPIDAFRYAVISNSGYLDLSQVENRLIIRRDFFRIFNQAEQESIQNGIFDRVTAEFNFTPNKFFKKYPRIIENNKYIIFLEYNPKLKIGEPPYYPLLRSLVDKIESSGLEPLDFIVTLIPSNNNPKDLESFFEYVINEKYRRMGYLTDSQLPFYYGIGTPDAAIYNFSRFRDSLFKNIGICGGSIIDLMCLKYQVRENCNATDVDDSVVFEIKTGSLDGSQIKKYLGMRIFKRGYEVIPHKSTKSDYAGLIHYNESGIEFIEDHDIEDTSNSQKYEEWLEIYVKCYLITNLSDSKFMEFKIANSITSTRELIDILKANSINEIVKLVMEEMNNAKN